MPKVTVDGIELEVPQNMTVLQACEQAGKEIPRFCYHERLAIAGNCRMCLVEVEGGPPKPVASCAHPIADGMVVKTNTEMVKKAREGVMEFLLINHPLDCPICDQGGECDLQDQAMTYGKGESRYKEHKRAVKDKYMGPLVKTHMTRCIHCTRCVRFLEDVAGTPELGAVERGEDMQVTTYVEKSLSSEMSGNIIDLCPVGALTSKPYAFTARSWELKKTETIDVMDAVGSNIRVDSKGNEVMRILPRLNEEINEEWISDKTRFSYDGLKYQRLDKPFVKKGKKFNPVDWAQALQLIKDKIAAVKPQDIGAVAGALTDVESMFVMKQMMESLGSSNYDCRENGSLLNNEHRALYTFNTTIERIPETDSCLIVGCNPRFDAPIVNAKIRQAYLNGAKVATIAESADLSYPAKELGNNPWILKQIAEGKHPYCDELKKAQHPMIIIGADALARDDYEAILYYAKQIATKYNFVQKEWNGFNVLQKSASIVGGMDIGFLPSNSGLATNDILKKCKVVFLMGADNADLSLIKDDSFVVYMGHHGDKAAYRANVILPVAAYTEKSATYINLEGRPQQSLHAILPPGDAKEDWKAVVDMSKFLGHSLGIDSLGDIRQEIANENDVFKSINKIIPSSFPKEKGKSHSFQSDSFLANNDNFYLSNSIARSSKTMQQCSKEKINK